MRVTGVAVLVLLLAVPLMAAADDPPRRCAMCAGAEIAIGTAPETVIPILPQSGLGSPGFLVSSVQVAPLLVEISTRPTSWLSSSLARL